MSQYNAPGVYVEEVPSLPPSVPSVGTAIPAFIGYTKNHGTLVPANAASPVAVRRIQSLLDYENAFGGPCLDDISISGATVTYNPTPYRMYYSLQHYFMNGGGPCYVVSIGGYASTPALTLADAQKGITALETHDEPTLYVFPDGFSSSVYNSVVEEAVESCANLGDRIVLAHVDDANLAAWRADAANNAIELRSASLANASFCAAYAPFLNTAIVPQADLSGVSAANLHLVKQAISNLRVTLPPTAAVAGAYVVNDATRGVHQAPANIGLIGVSAPTLAFNADAQGALNVDTTNGKSINLIRQFVGRGTLIWGARTMDGNSNEWRYVNVRRLYNMVEESLKQATNVYVFQPNTPATWQSVKTMVSNYLSDLWQSGALVGASPKEAFYVKVGRNETMTDQDILQGKMIVQVGLAVSRPAEFIVLQFSHYLGHSA